MVFQRLLQRIAGLTEKQGQSNRREKRNSRKRIRRRSMGIQTLDKREVLAANIAAIAGVAFVDQTGDGLTGDDPRLSSATVELFRDTNTNGTFDSGTDTLVGTDTTGSGATAGEYRFDNLSADTYFVVQTPSGTLTAPTTQTVVVTADDADGVQLVAIDDFTTGAQLVTATGSGTTDDSVAAAGALGAERDVRLVHTNGSGNTTFQVDTGTELLSLSTGGGATATATVEYDGTDGAFGLNVPPGFSPASALAGGTAGVAAGTNTGIEILARAENQAENLVVTIFTSATEASEATVVIPQDVATLQSIFVPFSSFIQSTDGGVTSQADFNDIIGVRANAEVTLADNDIFFSIVESRGPDPVLTNLANTQLVQLGGHLFIDNGPNAGEQNDGVRQGTEAGLAGVDVELYEVTNPGDTVDPINDVAIATTTTIANGEYLFTGLTPGHYVTVIRDAEFGAAQPLFGHISSTGNDPANDPDDNVDSDDNGTPVAGFGVVSGTITLESNSEPTNEVDDDDLDGLNSNRNLSLDFGVIPTIDIEITKTLNVAASDANSDGKYDESETAFFDIVVTNAGPLTATGVLVNDDIPTGLTFNAGNSTLGGITPTVDGNGDVEFAVGSIPSGGSISFQISTDIAANLTDDVTNTAVVSTPDQVDLDSIPALADDANNDTDTAVVDMLNTPLTIVKTAPTADVAAGGQFSYTITVTNDSTTDTVRGVTVDDVLETPLTFDATSSVTIPGQAANTNLVQLDPDNNNPQLVRATIGTLDPGEVATITIVVDVDTNAPATIPNVAVVSASPNTIPAANDNDDNADVTVIREVDLEIEKTISTQSPIAGGAAFTYTVTVTNNGPSIAENVDVDDDLNDFLTFVGGSTTGGFTTNVDGVDPTLLNFELGDIAPGAGNAVTFSFDVTLSADATGQLLNEATVTTDSTDTVAANNTDDVTVTIARDVNLAITKAVNVTTAVPGVLDNNNPALVWTIDVTNSGVSNADGVFVLDDIADDVTSGRITTITVNEGTFTTTTTNNVVRVDIGDLNAGATAQFTITAEIPAGATGDIVNNASVDSDDTTAVTSADVTTVLTPEYDLIIDKTVNGTSNLGPNDTVTFDLVVSHDTAGAEVSPSDATGVQVTDLLPSGLTFVSATSGGVAVTPTTTVNGDGTTTLVFPDFDLATGSTQALTVVATADIDADGTLTNTGDITDTDVTETDITNNDDSANVIVTPRADIRVAKTVDVTDAQVGSQLTYTVTVTNDGPSPAESVEAIDLLPAGVTFDSGTGPGNSTLTETGGQVTVPGGTLAVGGSFTFTILATVNNTATGNVQNQVDVTTTTTEDAGDLANNRALAVTTIDPETSTIDGVVYIDDDNDGVQDAGELGIAGVTITLTGTDSLGAAVNATQVTDANGFYEFTNLARGTYQLAQTQPQGFRDGQDTAGTGATATAADDVFSQIALGADVDAEQFNFGELAEALSKRRFLASTT